MSNSPGEDSKRPEVTPTDAHIMQMMRKKLALIFTTVLIQKYSKYSHKNQ